MSDRGALPANDPRTPTRSTRYGEVKDALSRKAIGEVALSPKGTGEEAHRRFGAAATLLESLDTVRCTCAYAASRGGSSGERVRHLVVAALCTVARVARDSKPKVYRCDANGKVAYSDAPCVGARIVDATATQGADKLGGASRKGRKVQRDEYTTSLDNATRPLHGRSHEETNVMRRRVNLPGRDQQACARLDSQLPMLEAGSGSSTGEAKARPDVDLYKARKQFFHLKC